AVAVAFLDQCEDEQLGAAFAQVAFRHGSRLYVWFTYMSMFVPGTSPKGAADFGEEATLESRRQIELEHPAAARPLERMREIEFADREAKQVHAQRDAGAADALPRSAEKRRPLPRIPSDAAVGEQRHLHRHRTVHPPRGAER